MGKKKYKEREEVYLNGDPCPHPDCNKPRKRTPCIYCGRTKARGTVSIKERTGFVHLERLWDSNIKAHNELSPEEQENHLLQLWRPPNE